VLLLVEVLMKDGVSVEVPAEATEPAIVGFVSYEQCRMLS
jgi:hypothetical protein